MLIRPAYPADLADLTRIAEAAYGGYVQRIGRRPRPMDDDYAARVRSGQASVAAESGVVVGLIVLDEQPDHLLIDNVAVDPSRQGEGLGRALMDFAESRAERRGYAEIRLFTHVAMTENRRLYSYLGFREDGGGVDDEFERIYFSKAIAPPGS